MLLGSIFQEDGSDKMNSMWNMYAYQLMSFCWNTELSLLEHGAPLDREFVFRFDWLICVRGFPKPYCECQRWAGHVARMGESRSAYRVLVGRPEGKRPLGRPRRRWEDNIKMDLREVGCDDRDRIDLAQDRDQWRAYVRAAMNLRHRKLPSICSHWVEGKPRKKPQPGYLPRPGIEPGSPGFAARRASRYSTGVDDIKANRIIRTSAEKGSTYRDDDDDADADDDDDDDNNNNNT
ncbi:hypothetical protein ANN_18279 [Periplaneta americana]|uniref:Aminotransferase-like plant mobile domain-containing protein n=1 Tax=Periplaneta americana TaxID=6978 RepID=A0ABQ8SNX9_PERAM|nr:hypothetical protein ANN_18279 [Periplaneta americana]